MEVTEQYNYRISNKLNHLIICGHETITGSYSLLFLSMSTMSHFCDVLLATFQHMYEFRKI